uniref:Protein CREG1 isoform X3 n=1 Tax=Geotrypetes seraphini TaxID=260995 RepID=A0A6P8QEM4_GEOSA|nr:protein CREG1 isoform X3 [Geotrypetes seraphini]
MFAVAGSCPGALLRGFLLLLLSLFDLTAASLLPPRNETARVARFVAHLCDWGALATVSSHEPVRGRPFANVFSVNPNASLTMSLAQTLYCKKEGYDPQSPLCAHIILSGIIEKVNSTEMDFAKLALFSRHPEMTSWPPDHGWFFAKLNITNIWVLDYFGGIKTVTPEDYYSVNP